MPHWLRWKTCTAYRALLKHILKWLRVRFFFTSSVCCKKYLQQIHFQNKIDPSSVQSIPELVLEFNIVTRNLRVNRRDDLTRSQLRSRWLCTAFLYCEEGLSSVFASTSFLWFSIYRKVQNLLAFPQQRVVPQVSAETIDSEKKEFVNIVWC